MAKIWVLDTETKGTGAHVVPLESTLHKPAAPAEPLYVPPKRAPRPPQPAEPRRPRSFKLVDVTSGEVLAEDVVGRFGGEEFVIGLPDAGAAGAAGVAEDVRAAVAERPLTIEGHVLTLTVSVGWATWEDEELGQLIARADGALYEAKAAGRDCVRPPAPTR